MLCLSRVLNESVVLKAGESTITVKVLEFRGNKVRLGFDAGPEVVIHREEVWAQIEREQNKLLPCKEWEAYFGTEVIDPDGWRDAKISLDTPITKKRFVELHIRSTTRLDVYGSNEEFEKLVDEIEADCWSKITENANVDRK